MLKHLFGIVVAKRVVYNHSNKATNPWPFICRHAAHICAVTEQPLGVMVGMKMFSSKSEFFTILLFNDVW